MPRRAEFAYLFDQAQLRQGWKLAQRRWRKLDALFIGFGVLNIILAVLSALVLVPRNPGGWVLLVAAFYLLIQPWTRYRMFLRRLQDTPGFGGPVRWVLTPAQLEVEGGGKRHAVPWNLVVNADHDDHGLVLRLEDRNFIWLPWSGLVKGSREDALGLATQRPAAEAD